MLIHTWYIVCFTSLVIPLLPTSPLLPSSPSSPSPSLPFFKIRSLLTLLPLLSFPHFPRLGPKATLYYCCPLEHISNSFVLTPFSTAVSVLCIQLYIHPLFQELVLLKLIYRCYWFSSLSFAVLGHCGIPEWPLDFPPFSCPETAFLICTGLLQSFCSAHS